MTDTAVDMIALTEDEVDAVEAGRKVEAMVSYCKRTGIKEASAYAYIQSIWKEHCAVEVAVEAEVR